MIINKKYHLKINFYFQGFRILLAHTLTTEDIIVWKPSLKQILSFTTNRSMINFINRFLKQSVAPIKMKCNCYCSYKTHFNKSTSCLTHYKVSSYEKNDISNQINKVSLNMSITESQYLNILKTITYECVIKDKVNFLSLWVEFAETILTLSPDLEFNFIWQVKFLHLFGLSSNFLKELDNFINIENILANKQQLDQIVDMWKNGLYFSF